MSTTDYYALYYDLLYSHRDIKSEVDFLEKMFREYSSIKVNSVLDVGCGTGLHSVELARRGYTVLGIDISREMIEKAREKSAGIPNVSFVNADVRSFNAGRRFDSAIAMYGVISYFVSDDDLMEALRSIRAHVNTGGLFVFDTWNLVGVQEKRLYYETPAASFRRSGTMLAIKEEVWKLDLYNQVAYAEILWSIVDLPGNKIDVFAHKINLRLFSPREIKHYLREAGFEVKAIFEDYACKPFAELSPEMVVVAAAI